MNYRLPKMIYLMIDSKVVYMGFGPSCIMGLYKEILRNRDLIESSDRTAVCKRVSLCIVYRSIEIVRRLGG